MAETRGSKSKLWNLLWQAFHVKEFRHFINARWLNVTLALQVKYMRKKRGWSQAELAKQAELSVITVVRFEKLYWGKTSPSFNTLLKIAAAFDVAVHARFTEFSKLLDEITGTPHVDNGLTSDFYDIATFEEEVAAGVNNVEG